MRWLVCVWGVFFSWLGPPTQPDGLQALFEITSNKACSLCVCGGKQPEPSSVMLRSLCCVHQPFTTNLIFSFLFNLVYDIRTQCILWQSTQFVTAKQWSDILCLHFEKTPGKARVCVCFVWQTIFVGQIGRASMCMAGLRENIPNCNLYWNKHLVII